jgi:hypothetical protein
MKNNTRQIIKTIFFPLLPIYRTMVKLRVQYLAEHNPIKLADFHHKKNTGRKINWENPQDLNEKINWLKFYSDTSEWTRLADKYKVREYVEQCGLSDILVKLYGHWTNPDDIDFGQLPDSFVLKTNNSSGTNIFVKDKSKIDVEKIRAQLHEWMKPLSIVTFSTEPHYLKIEPLIIAEEYLEEKGSFSSSLIDYKVWCFSGIPSCIFLCFNREKDSVCIASYDTQWNYHPEYNVFSNVFRDGGDKIPKPEILPQMLHAAEILSRGFPQVRVDFYIINNKLFFGEMTFTSLGGNMTYFARDFLLEAGKKVDLKLAKEKRL